MGLFQHNSVLLDFKNHLRDFLVLLKEFATDDNQALYEEERLRQLEEKSVSFWLVFCLVLVVNFNVLFVIIIFFFFPFSLPNQPPT